MTDLRHVAELLHEASVRRRHRTGRPRRRGCAARSRRIRRRSRSERARRLDTDAAAVQVLTIHASKGLQFPVVYLPTLSDTYIRTPDFPLYHDEQGRRCLDVGGADEGTPTSGLALGEAAGEELRLLYVALTRAQSQVVTWWLPNASNTAGSPLNRLLLGREPGQVSVPDQVRLAADDEVLAKASEWAAAGGPCVEQSVVQQAPRVPPPARRESLHVRRFTRRIDRDWARTSYTALASAAVQTHGPADLPVTSEPEDQPRADEPPLGAVAEPSAASTPRCCPRWRPCRPAPPSGRSSTPCSSMPTPAHRTAAATGGPSLATTSPNSSSGGRSSSTAPSSPAP